MEVLALITARGGSKGIPGKNLVSVGGRPLITWSIRAAQASVRVSRVVVSTDSDEIAAVARDAGADVPFLRPPEMAGDRSPHIDAVLHALSWMEEKESYDPDYVLTLQPTSPFRTPEDLDKAVDLACQKNADAVIGLCEVEHHPYFMRTLTPDGWVQEFCTVPDGYLPRQEMPAVYRINGALYLTKSQVVKDLGTFFPDRTYGYVMPRERSIDIDTPWDLHAADLIARAQGGEHADG